MRFETIENAIYFFQNLATFADRNPNWVKGTDTDDYTIPEPYYKMGLGKCGRISLTVSKGKGYNISVHHGNGGGGTIAKGTGMTIQQALDNLWISYQNYVNSYTLNVG